MKQYWIGFAHAMGVWGAVCSMLLLYAGVDYLMGDRRPLDPTDSLDGKRSGMAFYVDHGTGCQYVGGLLNVTPRLGADGKHVGCRQ